MVLVDINNYHEDPQGRLYRVSIFISEAKNTKMHPTGVRALFKLFRLNHEGIEELIILIDNHEPYGFHEHSELPIQRKKRVSLPTDDWKEAWKLFQKKCREVFDAT